MTSNIIMKPLDFDRITYMSILNNENTLLAQYDLMKEAK